MWNAPGGLPKRPKGSDCNSAGSAFGGSNPSPTTKSPAPEVGDFRLVEPMVDFVLVLEGRVLGRDEFGRPAKQSHRNRTDEKEPAHRDNDSGNNTERDTPRVHAPRLSE